MLDGNPCGEPQETIFVVEVWPGLGDCFGMIAEVQQSNQSGLQKLIYELATVCATIGLASFVQAYYTQIAGVRLILRIQNPY